ncbi:MAG: Dam family site-specific DNA-(adenine-N6)-methyltransferase [Stenotrophomonas geniculata]
MQTRQSRSENSSLKLIPPLKWAGGKRWFVARHLDLVPDTFERYVEPFLGSGAMFFALRPHASLLSDLNGELVNLYSCIRSHPQRIKNALRRHHAAHCEEYYYRVRAGRPRSDVGKAARMLYLNRTCWNGLYRVNKKGEFNVPIGTKDSVILESDDFQALSQVLHSAEIVCGDFEFILDRSGAGDFVFIDPPYTVAHNNNGFVKYNERLFGWEDQIRLRLAVDRAVSRGAKVLITNAAHASIYELYEGYEQITVSRAGIIAGSAASRGSFGEVVIKCY